MEYHEKTHEHKFIPNDYLSSLYLHDGVIKKVAVVKKPKTEATPKSTEPFIPGKKLITSPKSRSLLTRLQQLKCLAALKCLQSGKEPAKFTETEKSNIELYKVISSFRSYSDIYCVPLCIETSTKNSSRKC